MMEKTVTMQSDLEQYRDHLLSEGKNPETVKKYVRDMTALYGFLSEQGSELDQASVNAYLFHLQEEGYSVRSVNSAIASIKSFCKYADRTDIYCKSLSIRKKDNLDKKMRLTPGEYASLIQTAVVQKDFRMVHLLQVLGGTDIRMNELKDLTVEAVEAGIVTVQRAGEEYDIYLSGQVVEGLKGFAAHEGIEEGVIFRTSMGNAMDRSCIWRMMKALAVQAGVNPDKVYPRNLKRQLAKNYVDVSYPN